jgi:TonB family protein
MWMQGVDTSQVFRNMQSLSAMGILAEEFALSGGSITQDQFQKAIKRNLAELYRSNPTIVDSLFERYAAPELENVELGSDAVQGGKLKQKLLDKHTSAAFKAIDEHYEQPAMQKGIEGLAYPDTLRTEENSGEVQVQLHVNESGQVDAVEVVEGTHPILNGIVMKAATQTTWAPAYVTEDGQQTAYPGWGRISTNFPAPR